MSDILAIIPARGGSKRIPGKNLRPLAGKPLICHSIEHALASIRVKRTIVSTDDPAIADVARKSGAEVVSRPAKISGDTATSESALIHALDEQKRDPALVVFLQATSPVRRTFDIDRAVGQFEKDGLDSLFSACENNKLLWKAGRAGPEPVNYDYRSRKREQEFQAQYRENGSIYVFTPSLLRKEKCRLGGKIGVYLMPEWASFQVDQPWEVRQVEWILKEQARFEKEES
jgi:CMP-N,N'-diacetyllegionaminic acid synthase